MSLDIKKIIANFDIEGEYIYSESFGCGHINDTYAVYIKKENKPPVRYILQRINSEIFNASELMENICLVTEYLKERIAAEGGDPLRNTLTVVRTKNNESFYKDEEGNCLRVYLFIENTVSYQRAATEGILENAGKAFGHFQKLLFDFDASKLHEVIRDFHDTRKRFAALEDAIKNGIPKRIEEAKKEIDFALERKHYCGEIVTRLGKDIPLRVTHNDTKLNNILMDADTGESVCIIDLDTIMPGSVLYDIGDSIRFGANTALEDETDLSKVNFSLEMYNAYVRGFMSEMGEYMTDAEKELIPMSCILMTYENGIRFLADYLVGDTYFKTTHESHNLERARNQFKLICDMEASIESMGTILSSQWGRFSLTH